MARTFKVLAIHKQMYPATYNFKDDTDGDDPDGWTITQDTNTTVQVISLLGGHRKVVEFHDADGGAACAMDNTIDDITFGTLEFWIRTSDATLENAIGFKHGATIVFYMKIDDDKFQYYNGVYNDVGLAATDDTWYHIRVDFECTAGAYEGLAQYDWHIYIDGVLYGDYDFANNEAHLDTIRFNTSTGDTGYYYYIDSIGYSWDTDYNIGDNVHWRHYNEGLDASFEGEDTGTQGTTIDWVDATLDVTAVEIVNDFDEHKKFLRQIEVTGNDFSYHFFTTQSKTGWCEFWGRASDASGYSQFELREDGTVIVSILFDTLIQYYDGNSVSYESTGITGVNNKWYHIYIQWYDEANDTFDLWIDNVLVATAIQTQNNMTSGINRFLIRQHEPGDSCDIDACISSLDSDERADNRTFDYLPYTYNDITTDVKNVLYKNEIYKWREAVLLSEISYENSEIFFQIYDINDKLAMEAEIKNRAQISKDYSYSLRDKNQDDLEHRSSNTFSAKKIHDPTDSTSILKVILPNVSETEGDLLLVDADTKTTTYSPTTQNYPDYMILRDISDLANSVVIVHGNGKCYLDDDKASGTVLDKDTEADKDNMTEPPLVTDILETINYFEIFGAMNPDTGTRFTKIIDNVGTDKKRSWRYTNNAFLNQTDVDNYATSLQNRTATIKNIKFTAQSLGAHNMGETINYKFVDTLYNIPQANYYVIFEEINFDVNESVIILSEGMIEDSKYAATYERPENYNDSYASQIFESDINTISPEILNLGTATKSSGFWTLAAVGDGVQIVFFLDSMVDTDRNIVITWGYQRTDGAVDTVDITEHFAHALCDGANQAWTTVWNAQANSLPAEAQFIFNKFVQTLPAANLTPNNTLYVNWKINEALRFYIIRSCVVRYYIKRTV